MSFSNCLEKRMDMVGLPVPTNMKVLPAAIAATKLLSDIVVRYGTDMSFSTLVAVISQGSASASTGAVVSEIATVLGGAVASITVGFYLGALITALAWCAWSPNHPDVANFMIVQRANSFLNVNQISLSDEMRNCFSNNLELYASKMSGDCGLA